MCCVWPAAAICAAAEKEEETWKKWNGGGARRKGGGKSDMKRGRKKKDRQGAHESDGLFSQTHLSFSFPRHTFTQCSNTGFIFFFFFFPLPSLSLSVSSPRAIGPSVSRLHHIQSSHCVSLNECVSVCEEGGVIQFTGRLCIFVHPFGRLMFVYLFCCS